MLIITCNFSEIQHRVNMIKYLSSCRESVICINKPLPYIVFHAMMM